MRLIFGCLLISGCLVAMSADSSAADNKDKKDKAPATVQYTTVGDITAIVRQVNTEDGVTSIVLRLNAAAPPAGGRGKGGSGRSNQDLTLELTGDAKIRLLHLPPLLDANGKKMERTPEELQKLKGNSNLPGYQAEIGDLKADQIVQVRLAKIRGAKGEDAAKSFASRIIISGSLPPSATKKATEKKGDKK